MNWNDYEAVWKRQELPVGANADLADLKNTFETKRRKLAVTLMVRDGMEAFAGVLVAGVLVFVWWHIGWDGWPLVFAISLLLGVSVRFLRERLRARRLRVGLGATLLVKLEADITELQHQRQLLRTLFRWYLAPCLGAILLATAALVRVLSLRAPTFFSALWAHPAALAWIAGYFLVILPLLFWGIWALNLRAVRRGIEPRLAELEKLHRDLITSG